MESWHIWSRSGTMKFLLEAKIKYKIFIMGLGGNALEFLLFEDIYKKIL